LVSDNKHHPEALKAHPEYLAQTQPMTKFEKCAVVTAMADAINAGEPPRVVCKNAYDASIPADAVEIAIAQFHAGIQPECNLHRVLPTGKTIARDVSELMASDPKRRQQTW
jgi:DNA-directed RNA polymerase subunit K/omega